jgi:excisionase family DNA binding protein
VNSPANEKPGDFLSTRQAAAKLGVALSTVQAWVETGILPAWKTAGGHRRIPADAVEAMALRQRAVSANEEPPARLKVLVVEDDPVLQAMYRRQFEEWGVYAKLYVASDGIEGLLLIGRHNPDLIITDLAMPEMDGFAMLRRLKGAASPIRAEIIVVSGLTPEEVEARGGLPPGIPVYPKPVPFIVLRTLIEHKARRLSPS